MDELTKEKIREDAFSDGDNLNDALQKIDEEMKALNAFNKSFRKYLWSYILSWGRR